MQAQQNEFSDERSSDSVKRVIIQKILKDREKRRKENPELDWDKLSNMAKGLIRLEQEEAANPDTVYKGIVSQVRDYLTRQKKMDEQRRKSRHRANSNDYRERGRRISNHEEKSTKKRDNREDSFREADSKRQKQAEIPGLNDKKQLFSMDVNPNLIRNVCLISALFRVSRLTSMSFIMFRRDFCKAM